MVVVREEEGMCTNPNSRDNKRRTPLHFAVSSYLDSSRLDIVRILLAHGADVNAEDGEGRTPLQVALACGPRGAEMVQLLSEYCSK
jgi:ankyrin repeat protein